MLSGQPVFEMRGIHKIYPDGTYALRGVDFKAYPGEIVGLLGENGAGKTTLMKILSGIIPPSRGRILVRGRPVSLRNSADALHRGIGMVHQHFTLVDVFTVLENIVLGMEPARGLLSPMRLEEARARVEEYMRKIGFEVPLDARVEDLPVGVQQRVEILKMLFREVDVLILDEPTSVLTPLEVEELFKVLRGLKSAGKTIVFITHKLREVLEITDRVTVLRKGVVTGEVRTGETSPEELARMMVGREVVFKVDVPRRRFEKPRPLLEVKDLWVRGALGGWAVKGLSFSVMEGEIFGIAGVEGNGQSELAEALGGLRRVERGSVVVDGVDVTNKPPFEVYRRGLAHIPEDRTRLGLVLDMSVAENSILGMQRFPRFLSRLGGIRVEEVYRHARSVVDRFEIVAVGLDAPARSLSGGNQQKLVVGREVSKSPKVIVANQPTRGLDVAATEYIRRLLVQMRNEGKAVLLISADLDEVLDLSDRVAVMYEGRFMGVATPDRLDERTIGLMMGGVEVKV